MQTIRTRGNHTWVAVAVAVAVPPAVAMAVAVLVAVAVAVAVPTPAAEAQQKPRVKDRGPIIGNGPIPKAVLRRVIHTGTRSIRTCYERALVNNPGLAGRVIVAFTIAPTGKVVASRVRSSTLGHPAAERCIATRVRGLTFPKPLGGGIVNVVYPFVFKPEGAGGGGAGSGDAKSGDAKSGGAGSGDAKSGGAGDPPPARARRGCKTNSDCRLAKCCCTWRAFSRYERICKPAPCACAVPMMAKPFARCRGGRCVAVQDAKACYRRCLRNSRARAMAWSAIEDACRRSCAGPKPDLPTMLSLVPASRACKTDGDCVFAPRSGCGCPPCGPTRRSAVNRKHAARLRREHARESCPKVKCARCDRPLRWLGSHAICVRGACTVR